MPLKKLSSKSGAVHTTSPTTTANDTLMLPGYECRRGVRSFTLVGASQTPAVTYAASVDNTPPPMVTGLKVRYVPQIDACEVSWNPVPENGDPARPDTFEPNLGGYWVCPYIAGPAPADYHDTHLNHQSPLFRTHYVQTVPDGVHGDTWVFSVMARDRTGNKGTWCPDVKIPIPNLASTTPLATAYNNGTHLARVPGTANEQVVYESNSEVHYANSTDGGVHWHNRTVLDTGASSAIATNANGDAWVVYLKGNVARYSINSNAWSGGVLYNPQNPNVVLGPPAITAMPNYAYAAFPVYDLNAGTSCVKVVKFNDTASVTVTVSTPNQAMSDSFVSLSLTPGDSVHCCWQRASTILYSEASVAPAQWSSIVWSSPSIISPPGTVTKHPFCADWGNWVIVVWSDQGTGEIMRIPRPVGAPITWSLPQNVSNTQEFSDFPQASSPCVVSWQDLKLNGNWEVRIRADTELITLTSTTNGNSCYADISAELADSSDSAPVAVYAVWTDGTAADDYYEIKSWQYGAGQQGGQMAARQVPIAVTELSRVAPNPFSRSTGIRYQLAQAGRTRLSIFDAAGREVRTLVNSEQSRGAYVVTWDGTDSRQRVVPRGVYFVKFCAPQYTSQKNLVLTR